MTCGRLLFRTIEYGGASLGRDVVEFDVAILVGDHVELLEAGRRYREYGLKVYHYPLSPRDSPTLFSLLGIVGLIAKLVAEECKSVIVEGFGGERLLEYAAHLIGLYKFKPRIGQLQSPLHARSIYVLQSLANGGVDLRVEACKNVHNAFTGGDAHKSDIVEHSVDIVASLAGYAPELLDECPASIYRCVVGGRCGMPRLCLNVMEAAEAFDYDNVGAVKCVAVTLPEEGLGAKLYAGCRMLAWDECLPEVEAGYRRLNEMLRRVGLEGVENYSIVSPEEAACILYGERMGYPCVDGEEWS
jgi:hypothetical protein